MPILRKHTQITGFYTALQFAYIKGRMQVAIYGALPLFIGYRILQSRIAGYKKTKSSKRISEKKRVMHVSIQKMKEKIQP